MQIIIQNSGVSEHNARTVFDAAQELGIPTKCVGIIPFTYDLVGAEDIDYSIPTFWYGSTRLLEIAKRDHPNTGCFLNEDFNVLGAMPVSEEGRRDDMLNVNRDIIPIKKIHCAEVLMDYIKLQDGRPIFIRPNSSLKLFAGVVVNKSNYKDIFERNDFQAALSSYRNEKLCISPYKEIWAEWRFFVVDGTLISGSLYKEAGRLEMRLASQDMLLIAQAMTEKWMPSPTCVMDVALTVDGLKVVEFNSVNSSGGYCCDWKKILTSLQDLIG